MNPVPFGRYQLQEELGRGGMGIVYKALDTVLNRDVALKIINSEILANESEKKRFFREARLMGKIKHPGTVEIYDVGEIKGRTYFTMEVIAGESLDILLKQKISSSQLILILSKVAQIVHYAHQQGVIHRDLKPSNIMIDVDNEPKVLDFGLAKELQDKENLSKSKVPIGTLAYMPPEQASGNHKEIDAQSDIYSLGIILYEILVGRPPFTGDSLNILYQIWHSYPKRPTRVYGRISKDIEAICLKAIEKEKVKRYDNAAQFAEELDLYLSGKPVTAKPITTLVQLLRWFQRYKVGAILGVTTIVFIIGLVVYFTWSLQIEKNVAQKAKILAEEEKEKVERQKSVIEQKNKELVAQTKKAIIGRLKFNLVVIRNAIERKDYFDAYKGYQAFNREIPKISSLIKHEHNSLLKARDDMFDYCISPHPHKIKKISSSGFWLRVQQPSQKYRIVTRSDGKHIITDKTTNRTVLNITIPTERTLVAFSPNHRYLAIGYDHGAIIICDLKTQRKYTGEMPKGFDNVLRYIQFSFDGKTLLAVSKDSIVLWQSPKMIEIFYPPFLKDTKNSRLNYDPKHTTGVFSSDNKYLILGNKTFTTSFFDIKKPPKNRISEQTIKYFANVLCFDPYNKKILMATSSNIVIADIKESFDVKQKLTPLFNAHKGDISHLAMAPGGNFFMSIGRDSLMKFWSTHHIQNVFSCPIFENVDYINYDFNKNIVTITGNKTYQYQWKSKLYKELDLFKIKANANHGEEWRKRLLAHPNASGATKEFSHLVFSSDSRYLAYDAFPKLYIWDLKRDKIESSKEPLWSYQQSKRLDFRHDKKIILKANYQKVALWDVASVSKLKVAGVSKRVLTKHSRWLPGTNYLIDKYRIWQLQKTAKPGFDYEIKLYKALDPYRELSEARVVFSKVRQLLAYYDNSKKTGALDIWDYSNNKYQRLAFCVLPEVNIQAVCFSQLEHIAIGSHQRFIIYNWRTKTFVHEISLSGYIKKIEYDVQNKRYWIHTFNSLFIYPDDEKLWAPDYKEYYPLPIYPGYPMITTALNRDFSLLAIQLPSAKVLLFQLN